MGKILSKIIYKIDIYVVLCDNYTNIAKSILNMSQKKFREPKALNDVGRFHETFDLPIRERPVIPSKDRCALRVNLIEEELEELKDAIDTNDLVEIADALCDIQYVLSGAVHEFGLSEVFATLFEEVQRSNMSKTCSSLEEAEATQDYYLMTKSTPSVIEKKGDKYLVFRSSDRKVLKSVNYSPADLKTIIRNALERKVEVNSSL